MDIEPLQQLCDELIVVCRQPVFDEMATTDESNLQRFEGRVVESMIDFDPDKDAVAFYGDAVILAIMVMNILKSHDHFTLLRWSSKANSYVSRLIDETNLEVINERA